MDCPALHSSQFFFSCSIKPDIISPGDGLLSANSAGNEQQSCSTIQMTGRLMTSLFLLSSLSLVLPLSIL
jgi:hypothetical protein